MRLLYTKPNCQSHFQNDAQFNLNLLGLKIVLSIINTKRAWRVKEFIPNVGLTAKAVNVIPLKLFFDKVCSFPAHNENVIET